MKKTALLSVLIAMGLTMTSCYKIRLSPKTATENRYYENFDQIDVSNAFQVFVTYSDSDNKIVVEANENLQSKIITDITNSKLTIKFKPNVRIKNKATLKVYITVPTLNYIKLSGASSMEFMNQLSASYLNTNISGASSITGAVALTSGNYELSGASNITFTGSIQTATLDLSGASSFSGYACSIDNLTADLSGASSANLTVNQSINLNASGASSLNYKGDATVSSIDLSGASSIQKK